MQHTLPVEEEWPTQPPGPPPVVLHFSVEGDGSEAEGGMSAGAVGVLEVEGACDDTGDEAPSTTLPASMRLWFPVAAGGVGVSLTPSHPARSAGPSGTINGTTSGTTNGSASSRATGSCGSSGGGAAGVTKPQKASNATPSSHPAHASPSGGSATAAAAAAAAAAAEAAAAEGLNEPGAIAGDTPAGAAAAPAAPGKLRKFSPVQPARRSVIMLAAPASAAAPPSSSASAAAGAAAAPAGLLPAASPVASSAPSAEGGASPPVSHPTTRGRKAPQQKVVTIPSERRAAAAAAAATARSYHGGNDSNDEGSDADDGGSGSVSDGDAAEWQNEAAAADAAEFDEAAYHRGGKGERAWGADIEAQGGEFDDLDPSPADDDADERYYEELLEQLGDVAMLHRRRAARATRSAGAGSAAPPAEPLPSNGALAGSEQSHGAQGGDGGGGGGGGAQCVVEEVGEDDDSSEDDDGGVVSAAPFFGPPPSGFKVQISSFGLLWTLLGDWVTNATVAYVTGSVGATGGGGMRQSAARGVIGDSGELNEALCCPTKEDVQVRTSMAGFLEQALVPLTAALRLQVPGDDVRRKLNGLLRTLTPAGPVPALSPMEWQLLAAVLLKALSVYHLPALSTAAFGAAAAAAGRDRLRAFLGTASCTEPLFEWLAGRLTGAASDP